MSINKLSEKFIRFTLGTILLLLAINAFGGGYYGMAGAKNVPVEWLKGSPFQNYFLPSLMLFVGVGGSALIAAILVFKKHSTARRVTFICVAIVFVWLFVQITIIGYVSWMQPTTAITAFLILLLNWLLPKSAIKINSKFNNANMNYFKITILLICLWLPVLSTAQTTLKDETQFTISGFGRTSFVWDDQNLGRSDLFVPANIKVNTTKNPNFFIGSKQTRIGFDVKHLLSGETLSIKIEGDFHNDASDANGMFRMRHAYANYRFILVGMTWSNFFDEEVNPTSVDFEGPNSSTLSRTPQIRFSTFKSKNVLSLSLENPIENITVGGTIAVLPERFPDIIGAYRFNGNFGFVKAAALFRELRYESDKPRSLMGYGVTIMASIKTGEKDKLKFQGVMGTGVAKYIQGASGLNYDAVYDSTNELEALQMSGANISFQHFWKDHMHSSITAGLLSAENNSNLGPTDYQYGYYGSVNFFWDAVKNLTFGCEVVMGERVNVNDDKGSALRLQMSATYKFNKSFN